MKQALLAALGTLLAAAGIAGGTFSLVEPKEVYLPLAQIPEPPKAELLSVEILKPEPEPPVEPGPEPYVEPFMVEREPFVAEVATMTVAATTSKPNRKMGSGVEQWRSLTSQYFSGSDVDTALCLMSFESGGNPDAQNERSGASGLMQVLPSWADKLGYERSQLFDPDTNLSIARYLYDDNGWLHWSPYLRGECH